MDKVSKRLEYYVLTQTQLVSDTLWLVKSLQPILYMSKLYPT